MRRMVLSPPVKAPNRPAPDRTARRFAFLLVVVFTSLAIVPASASPRHDVLTRRTSRRGPFGIAKGVAHALDLERARQASRNSRSAVADRLRSRTAYRGLSRRRALAVDLARIPELRQAPPIGLGATDAHVDRYVGSRTAVVSVPRMLASTPGGRWRPRRALVQSSLPLRARTRSGRLAPVSLRLGGGRNGYELSNPLARTTAARRLGAGALRFTDLGVTVRPVGVAPVGAQPVARKLIYVGAQRDTDFVITPSASGADTGYVLRSAVSPERLVEHFNLPAGTSLRSLSAAGRHRPPKLRPSRGPIVIRRGRNVLATIFPPAAVDSHDTPVPLTYRVVGSNLVMRVRHRGGHYAYPISVDPFISEDQRYWHYGNSYGTPDFNGWVYQGNGYIGGYRGDPGPIRTIYGNIEFGSGINLYSYAGTYPGPAVGQWVFQAPGVTSGPFANEASHIIKADFGYTSHVPTYTTGAYSGWDSCQVEGIYDVRNNRWEPGLAWRGPTPTSSFTPGPLYYCGLDYASQFSYRVFCTSVCGDNGGDPTIGSPGNEAILQMWMPHGGTASASGVVYMGSSLIFESDNYAPHIDTSGVPSTWIQDAPITLSATDYGVGTYSLTASAPGWSGNASGPPAGCDVPGHGPEGTNTPGQPNRGDRNHRCPIGVPVPLSVSTSQLAEGSYNLTAAASDVIGNTATRLAPIKIDRTAPQQTLSGPLYDASDQGLHPAPLTDDQYSLRVKGDDSKLGVNGVSGIRQIQVAVDGNPPRTFAGECIDQGCTATSGQGTFAPSLEATYVFHTGYYAAGPHSIVVTTTDNAGHQTSRTLHVTTAPSRIGAASDTLGLEHFYQYQRVPTGVSTSARVNLATGNLVWSATPLMNPGRGLSTFMTLTYNSQHRLSDILAPSGLTSPFNSTLGLDYDSVGSGWSVGMSGLTRLNEPLDIIEGSLGVTLTDEDGTQHYFPKNSSSNTYTSPPGVHLHLRKFGTGDRTWAITRPDGVTYFYSDRGDATQIVDRNGNAITYHYAYVYPGTGSNGGSSCPGAASDPVCVPQVSSITDPGGRSVQVDYYQGLPLAGGLLDPRTGKIKDIVDHLGHRMAFTYDTGDPISDPASGELVSLTEADGTADARTFRFGYQSASFGSPFGAIQVPTEAELSSVQDPRGNSTSFTYAQNDPTAQSNPCPPQDPSSLSDTTALSLTPVCVSQITDRASKAYGFSYSATGTGGARQYAATVTDPRSLQWHYTMDSLGRPVRIVDPRAPTPAETDLAWSSDNQLTRLTQAAGTADETVQTMGYDPNGLLVSQSGPNLTHSQPNGLTEHPTDRTRSFAYQYSTGAPSLTASGDSSGFVADPTSITDARGNTYAYSVDSATGDVRQVTDPEGNTARTDYNPDGTVRDEVDYNGQQTNYQDYDANGVAQTRIDPLGRSWHYRYDADGNLTASSDPRAHASVPIPQGQSPYTTQVTYDALNRRRDVTVPKDSSAGVFSTSHIGYDANDNQTSSTDKAGNTSTATFTPMDRLASSSSPPVPHAGASGTAAETTRYGYDAAENLISVTRPKGDGGPTGSFQTEYTVDEVGEPVVSVQDSTDTGARPRVTSYAYDLRGDLTALVDPATNDAHGSTPMARANVANPAYDRSVYQYDGAGDRVVTVENPQDSAQPSLRYTSLDGYDGEGNHIGHTDPRGYQGVGQPADPAYTRRWVYDKRNLLIESDDPTGVGGKTIFKRRGDSEYPGTPTPGDGKISAVVSPNGSVSGSDWTTSFGYDPNGWLASYTLPTAPGEYPVGQGSVRYSRDEVGDPTTITDGRGQAIANSFYDTGELKSTDHPFWWTYDPSHQGQDPDPNSGGANQVSPDTPGGFDVRERTPDELAQAAQQRSQHQLPDEPAQGNYGGVDPQTSAGLIPDAGVTNFGYDGEMRLTDVAVQRNGGSDLDISISRDALGRVTDVQAPFDGATRTVVGFGYDPDGNLAASSVTEAAGKLTTTYGYDQFDQRVSTSAPGTGASPEVTAAGYDLNGNQTSLTTPVQTAAGASGQASISAYDGLDRLTSETDPVGDQTTYGYDAAGNQTRVTSPLGNTGGAPDPAYSTVNGYDALNHLTATTAGTGSASTSTRYQYDGDGNQTEARQLDGSGNACGAGDGCSVTATTYDGRDLPWTVTQGTGPNARTTVSEYDQDANLRRSVNNAGVDPSTKRPFHPDAGDSPPSGDANLNATVRQYDENAQLRETYLPWGCPVGDNSTSRSACDPTQTSGADARRWREEYTPSSDGLDRTTSVRGPYQWQNTNQAVTTSYTYYDNGWIHTSTGQQVTDTQGDPVEQRNSTYTYDHRGDELTWQGVLGSGRHLSVTRAYFDDGLLRQRSASADSEATRTYTYAYDPDHNLTSFTDPKVTLANQTPYTSVTGLVYDAADRLLLTNVRPPGVSGFTGGSGDTRFVYDRDGNVAERDTDGTATAPGTPPGFGYSDGKTTTFSYDALDRQRSMHVNGAGDDPNRDFSWTYTPAGLRAQSTSQQGSGATVTETRSYDDAGQLTRATRSGSPGKDQAYSYDADGNRTSDERGTHAYNALDQQTKWTRGPNQPNSGSSVTYVLNGSGGVSSQDDTANPATTTTYSLLDNRVQKATAHLDSAHDGSGDVSYIYCYNDLGDLTKITKSSACTGQTDAPNTTTTYGYDSFERTVSASGPDPTSSDPNAPTVDSSSYTYDGLDRRDTKTQTPSGGTAKSYGYSYLGLTDVLSRETTPDPASPNAPGVKVHTYDYDSAYAPVGLSSHNVGANTTSYHAYATDSNGSIEGLENPDGNIDASNQYHYDPYGNLENKDPQNPTKSPEATLGAAAQDNPFRFEGFYDDAGINTYDMLARDYRPDLQRFTTQDRYEASQGDYNLQADPLTNDRYAFAAGNPVTNIEYDGHCQRTSDRGIGPCPPQGAAANTPTGRKQTKRAFAAGASIDRSIGYSASATHQLADVGEKIFAPSKKRSFGASISHALSSAVSFTASQAKDVVAMGTCGPYGSGGVPSIGATCDRAESSQANVNNFGAQASNAAAIVVLGQPELGGPIGSAALEGISQSFRAAGDISQGLTDATTSQDATKDVEEGAGVVYRRTDLNGGKPYVGQSKSLDRYATRQSEHAYDNPLADFSYEILGRAEPGTELDRLEEFNIRREGGPTNGRNPEGGLANKRHQMSQSRYQDAGGDYRP